MNKKEAIEFLKDHKVEVSSLMGKPRSSDDVIAFIRKLDKKCKRGIKFEKMCEEIYIRFYSNKLIRQKGFTRDWSIKAFEIIEQIKQKYFPKEK